jgi:hypothetical protein
MEEVMNSRPALPSVAATTATLPQSWFIAMQTWILRFWQQSKPLTLISVASIGLFVLFTAGIFLDPRYITAAPAWLKPLKFAISSMLYSFILLWMLTFLKNGVLKRIFAGTIGLMLMLEFVGIVTQVVRGTTSHFNFSTSFDGFVFSYLMGLPIMVLTLCTMGLAVLVQRQRDIDPVLGLGMRLGLAITVLGMLQAVLMTLPTPNQLAELQAGAAISTIGAHSVGVPDGSSPGLPLVGWNQVGGDLRVGHFVGLHGLQVLPLLAWLLLRPSRLRRGQRLGLVWLAGLGYTGLMLLVTWQALRGQALLAPDALTLAAAAALAAAVALGLWLVLQQPFARAVNRPERPAR